MEEELQKLIGQQVPIKTRTGGRCLDYINEVKHGVVVLTTNTDGTGRRTVLAVDCIESFTTGALATSSGAASAATTPNWMKTE
ncbi:MAG: hypothetical protein IH849_14975 [Acidobacteria bacterium]|nr:hypothetical protein [Acidobacteriota bacterium]